MSFIRTIGKKIPGLRSGYKFIKRLKDLYQADKLNRQHFLNGHFYSTIPSLSEISENEKRIINKTNLVMQHILHDKEMQKNLLSQINTYYKDISFPDQKNESYRFYYENNSFPPCDAVMLYGMIRALSPKKWIEVGCGFSSAVTLDTNELCFNNKIECTFIDPYPELLESLLKKSDADKIRVIKNKIQDVDLELFEELKAGDVLFIDSSHVVKTGSDVGHILFNILPKLNDGVYIHFHDIHYPFEWPREWLIPDGYPDKNEMGGTTWNEPYFLQAFLAYNVKFKIIFFQTEITQKQKNYLSENMPLCLKRASGSIWLQKN